MPLNSMIWAHDMGRENKTELGTFRFRGKDKQSGKRLTAAAHAVNLVWNHCNGAQVHALTHNQKWPGKTKLESLTRGAGKLIGIPAQTIQGVVEEYVDRRRATRKVKLRWRGKRSLGWIPFKNQTIVLAGSGPFQRPQAPTLEASRHRRSDQVR
jgi:putative transposase